MTTQVTITPDAGQIQIRGPYSTSNNDAWRALGGKYSQGAWHLPDNSTTRETVAQLFGCKSELIEVLVPLARADGSQTLQIGGYVLASRRSRDSRAEMPDGVSLAAGSLPRSGGSVKSPRVAADADTVFRLTCRVSFAQANGLQPAAEPEAPTIEI